MSRKLLIYGASGHGRVVADAALASGWELVGWADDDVSRAGEEVADAPVVAIGLSEVRDLAQRGGIEVAVAIGDNRVRRELGEALHAAGVALAVVVHPSAVISRTASIGEGAVILAGTVVGCDSVVGRGAIVNTGTTVDHDCRLGAWCHLSPGVHLGGGVTIGDGTHLGIGVAVRNDVEIGSWSLVGVGSAVVQPIGDRVVVWGVPARVVRPHEP